MAKQQSSKSNGCMKQVCTPAAPSAYKARNIKAVNPKTEQFAPTDAAPIRQQTRMAGGG